MSYIAERTSEVSLRRTLDSWECPSDLPSNTVTGVMVTYSSPSAELWSSSEEWRQLAGSLLLTWCHEESRERNPGSWEGF